MANEMSMGQAKPISTPPKKLNPADQETSPAALMLGSAGQQGHVGLSLEPDRGAAAAPSRTCGLNCNEVR